MSDISIRRSHHLSLAEVRDKAEQVVKKLQDKHGGDYQWQGDRRVDYNYPAVNARVTFDDENLTVDVELGLFMKALKGMLEDEIKTYLDKYLA